MLCVPSEVVLPIDHIRSIVRRSRVKFPLKYVVQYLYDFISTVDLRHLSPPFSETVGGHDMQ